MEGAGVPWIFLSHSGKQKKFTRSLYQELERVGHHAFFDQDAERSLPKGHPFPHRIVDACRRCKMGIVVLSDDYMNSMWPMVELEQLCFYNPSILIYPLFYALKPVDLAKMLTQWQSRWNSRASVWPNRIYDACSIHIDMSSWPAAVNKLKHQNGEVLPNGMKEDDWIDIIIANICKTLPPPQRYSLSHHIKGADRLQWKIDQLFLELPMEANGVIPLGVHGKGESGKTTLCKTMANFYNRDFPGRSYWLEFPSDDDKEVLLNVLKGTLSMLVQITDSELKRIYSIEEAMSRLEEVLERNKVFLAIDNVWNWNSENARQIVKMKYKEGSKVMVSSRSEKVLQYCMAPKNVVHVPSVSEGEALEVLLSYSANQRSLVQVISREDLENLAELCFAEDQCNPAILTLIGAGLAQVAGGNMDHKYEDWKEFTYSYLEGCGMHAVDDILQFLTGLSAYFVAHNLPLILELENNVLPDIDDFLTEIEDDVHTFGIKIEAQLHQLSTHIENVDVVDELTMKIEERLEIAAETCFDRLPTRAKHFVSSLFDD